MAVTKILARKGRLDVGINYVLNGDKTEDKILTPDYVHPIARNFEDFLRLLLACSDATVLEQAYLFGVRISAFIP